MIIRVLSILLLLTVSVHAQSVHQSEHAKHKQQVEDDRPLITASSIKSFKPLAISKQSYGFHPYWAADTIGRYYRWDLLSTIAYFGAEIDPLTGGIAATNRWRTSTVIDSAHANGVSVHLTAILFSQHDSILANPARRAASISSLLALAAERNADGINIDFEAVPGRLRDSMTAYIRELRSAAPVGFAIVIDLPPVDWNNAFDVATLSQYIDHFFLMAYDYHWQGGPTAGAVAPLNSSGLSVSRSVSDYQNKGIALSQTILGMPWYGYDWPTVSDAMGAATLGTAGSVTTAFAMQQATIYGRRYDALSESPTYTYMLDNVTRQVWYDDAMSLLPKYQFAIEQGLAGIGYWAISYAAKETAMWNTITFAMGMSSVAEDVPKIEAIYRIPEDAKNVVMYDVTGRIVSDASLAGMYFLRFIYEGREHMIKIIQP